MGKVFRLTRQLNFCYPVFRSHCIYLPTPDPARRPGITAAHKAFPYMVMLPARWWRVGSILNDPFPI